MSSGGSQSSQPAVFKGGYRIQTSTFKGLVIVYGSQRIAGNILTFLDFAITTHGGGKGFGSGSFTQTYSEFILTGLCQGPIDGVLRVWKGSGASTLLPAATVAQRYDIKIGTVGQAIEPYITNNHPGYAIGYSGIAYAWTKAREDIGTSTQPPQYNWEVNGIGVITPGIVNDANPAFIITDILTNVQYGLGTVFQSAWLGDMASSYFLANQFLLSVVLDKTKKVQEILKQIADLTGGDFRWSGSLYQYIPYGDQTVTANGVTFVPNLTPVYNFTDDDYTPANPTDAPVQITVKQAYSDQFNRLGIEFLNRANNYDPETVYRELQDDIQNSGVRTDDVLQAHEICDPLVATLVAQMRLQRQFTVVNEYRFKLDSRYFLLDPLDIVSLTDTKTGLNALPVRIVSIAEATKDWKLSIVAEDLGVTTPALYPAQPRRGQAGGIGGSVPVDINPPIIFEPTVTLANLSHGLGELWFAVSGQNGNESWGGYYVYMSEDGITYDLIAGQGPQGNAQQGPATMGTLISSLARSTTNPDVATNTIAVDLSESAGTLVGTTDALAKTYHNLCYVDGEFISFANAGAGSFTGAFNLTYLYRHLFGTINRLHAVAGNFAYLGYPTLIDPGIFRWKYPSALVGKTLFFQFCSFNQSTQEVQPLGTGAVYTYTISGVGVKVGKANLIPDSDLKAASAYWPNV